MDKYITITIGEYNRLIDRCKWLDCLEQAGVDNWDGYDYAVELQDSDE